MMKHAWIIRLYLIMAAAMTQTLDADAAFSAFHDFTHIGTVTADETVEIRRQWLGPFYEYAQWEDDREFRAVRPFYSRLHDAHAQRTHTDLFWPLGSWRRRGNMRSGRLLIAFFQNYDTEDPLSQSRTWILPFYFSGHSRFGEPYTAVFPIAGRILGILGLDEVRFLAFPLYAETRKGPVATVHVLWPVFARSTGPGHERLRVFPFYGQSSEPDGTERRFVLWPIWSSFRREGTRDDGDGFVLFPLFGHVATEQQSSIMLLPPFFRYSKHPRGTELYYPWPFLQRSTGEIEKNYIWPIWGRKRSAGNDRAFILWPLGRFGRQERGDAIAIQHTVFPFYYSRRVYSREASQTDTSSRGSAFLMEGRPSERYEKIWPLYSYQRDKQDTVFRAPAIWPGRPFVPIERNYSAFWTLYSKTQTDTVREHELLWGLFRRRVKESGGRRTQVFPLIAWERDAEGDDRQISILRGLFRFGRENDRSFGSIVSIFRWGHDGEDGP